MCCTVPRGEGAVRGAAWTSAARATATTAPPPGPNRKMALRWLNGTLCGDGTTMGYYYKASSAVSAARARASGWCGSRAVARSLPRNGSPRRPTSPPTLAPGSGSTAGTKCTSRCHVHFGANPNAVNGTYYQGHFPSDQGAGADGAKLSTRDHAARRRRLGRGVGPGHGSRLHRGAVSGRL